MSRCTFVFRHLLYKDNFRECLHTISWLKCTYSLFNTAVQSLITRQKKNYTHIVHISASNMDTYKIQQTHWDLREPKQKLCSTNYAAASVLVYSA